MALLKELVLPGLGIGGYCLHYHSKQAVHNAACRAQKAAFNTRIATGQLLPDAGVVTHGRRPQ